jgi:hypothetical protein
MAGAVFSRGSRAAGELIGVDRRHRKGRSGKEERAPRMPIELYDLVGFAGAALLIVTYFANQQRWLRSEDWRYPAANLAGAALILVSLLFAWNFPSVVIEVFWAMISIWGIVRATADRRAR